MLGLTTDRVPSSGGARGIKGSGPRVAALLFLPLALLAVLAMPARADAPGQYLSLEDFLAQSFAGEGADAAPEAKVLWLSSEQKARLEAVSGKRFPLLRVRYWQRGERSAWVLEEIGKELPITIGVVVEGESIANIEVLTFRESRGWEVRHGFFTRQFVDARLDEQNSLSRHIDGITGATLSVRAVKRVARLALVLANEVQPSGTLAARKP